jgi:PAS domain S-box-containing protein
VAFVEPDELIRSLEGLPVAAILTELPTHTFVAVNEAAATLFGSPASQLLGTDVLARVDPRDREAARAAYKVITDRVVDGYQVRRRIVRPDGEEVELNICGRRVEADGKLYGLWVLVPVSAPNAGFLMLTMGSSPVVLAVTDDDWGIQYVSADAKLLGVKGSELRGFPLLGLVHPAAASEFLAAASRAATEQVALTVLTRMRAGADRWADRYCVVVPMSEHKPPRLGVVISEGPSVPAGSARDSIHEQVRNLAVEARGTQALTALPSLAALPQGSELSARQSEIVALLIAGERVPQIARTMFLSATTVRNHLSAIYKKFGVHSQAELLAALLRNIVGGNQ